MLQVSISHLGSMPHAFSLILRRALESQQIDSKSSLLFIFINLTLPKFSISF